MISATRRKFMSMVGVGAAASPLAVKRAADQAAMGLTGVKVSTPDRDAAGAVPEWETSNNDKYLNTADFIQAFGLPEVIRREIWQEAGDRIYYLDPDLAVKRSWSLSVKFQEQRQRNYKRAIASIQERANEKRARALLKSTTGIDYWPW